MSVCRVSDHVCLEQHKPVDGPPKNRAQRRAVRFAGDVAGEKAEASDGDVGAGAAAAADDDDGDDVSKRARKKKKASYTAAIAADGEGDDGDDGDGDGDGDGGDKGDDGVAPLWSEADAKTTPVVKAKKDKKRAKPTPAPTAGSAAKTAKAAKAQAPAAADEGGEAGETPSAAAVAGIAYLMQWKNDKKAWKFKVRVVSVRIAAVCLAWLAGCGRTTDCRDGVRLGAVVCNVTVSVTCFAGVLAAAYAAALHGGG